MSPSSDESAGPASALDPQVLARLLDVTRRINSETDPDAILGTIVDSLVSIAHADRGFLMLRGEDGQLRFTVARDRKGQPLTLKLNGPVEAWYEDLGDDPPVAKAG